MNAPEDTPRSRAALRQPGGRLFLADGGIETELIFRDGVELPDFASFDLLRRPGGEELLLRYFCRYTELARRHGTGLVLESATWRASADWAARRGCYVAELARINRRAVELLVELREEHERETGLPLVVSGCIGPRGDGYVPDRSLSADEAEAYHGAQVDALAEAGPDLLSAITMNAVGEAIGIARAAGTTGLPVVVAFTVETDGRLPTGQPLAEAIAETDASVPDRPAYYMLNCAHPDHFAEVLAQGGDWLARLGGLRVNASRSSHAELNESPVLDEGDPDELGRLNARLAASLPGLAVLGGCCGTDARHIERIAVHCAPVFAARGR